MQRVLFAGWRDCPESSIFLTTLRFPVWKLLVVSGLNRTKCHLPPEVHRFVATASQWCCFSYEWKPTWELLDRLHEIFPAYDSLTGGASFCEADRFANYDHRAHLQTYFSNSPLFASVVEEDRSDLLMLTPPEAGDQLALHIGGNESDERGGLYCRPRKVVPPPSWRIVSETSWSRGSTSAI